jgi:hypothetical protein
MSSNRKYGADQDKCLTHIHNYTLLPVGIAFPWKCFYAADPPECTHLAAQLTTAARALNCIHLLCSLVLYCKKETRKQTSLPWGLCPLCSVHNPLAAACSASVASTAAYADCVKWNTHACHINPLKLRLLLTWFYFAMLPVDGTIVRKPERIWKAVWRQDSVVSAAERLKMDYREIATGSPVWVTDCLSSKASRSELEHTQLPVL